MDIFRISLSRQ